MTTKAQEEIAARALAWFTARNALAEMNEKTDCGGNYNYCTCDDNDSCAECGIHGDIHAQMCETIDAATALAAVLLKHKIISL